MARGITKGSVPRLCVSVVSVTLASFVSSEAVPLPSGQGCVWPDAKQLPYCDHSKTHEERIADLISRMTLSEKAIHLYGSGGHRDNTTFPGIPRLGLPSFDWGLEAQHGLRVNCVVDPTDNNATRCPTTYPAPTGLGATFNDSLVKSIGYFMGLEARALNNAAQQLSGRLVLRTPVVNLIRDPRWGRNVECPSEDPVHAGRYGAAMVSGVQTPDNSGFHLGGTEMKHFAVYQVEDCGRGGTGPGIPSVPTCSRMKFDANVSKSELNETYFVPFQGVVDGAEGGPPTGYMCSYNAVNGVPACADGELSDTIRSWGFKGYCGTDCSAADGVYNAHGYASDTVHAYADTIKGGSDLICHPQNITALYAAVDGGFISESDLDKSLTRSFGVLFSLGLFDPLDGQPYPKIGLDVVGGHRHMKVALEAARQSTVLLLNRDNTLPISFPKERTEKTFSIAVVGPQANATGQLAGNYVGSECPTGVKIWDNMAGGGGQDSWWPCVPTLHQAISTAAPTASVEYIQGCEVRCSGNTNGSRDILTEEALLNPNVCNSADRGGVQIAVDKAMPADLIVLGLGFDTSIAGEGHDRLDMGLPGAQEELALEVLESVKALRLSGKQAPKVVLVLYAGASVSLDSVLAVGSLDALLIGHMPGVTGGTAVAEAIFGLHNDFGKLPYTVYPHSFQNQSSFVEMSFRKPPGRTHRFYSGTPQFAFGAGLSYSTFAIGHLNSVSTASQRVEVSQQTSTITVPVVLRNDGSRSGSQVVFAWLEPSNLEHRRNLTRQLGQTPPNQSLVGYMRSQSLTPRSEQVLNLEIASKDMMFTSLSKRGGGTMRRLLPGGQYRLRVDCGPSAEAAALNFFVDVHGDVYEFDV